MLIRRTIKAGSTGRILSFPALDSTSTAGGYKTGLTYSGFTAYYGRQDAGTGTQITPVTMTAGTWASGGIVEKSAANMPGVYQFGVPDACLATGADECTIVLRATGMVEVVIQIELETAKAADVKVVADAVKARTDNLPAVPASKADADAATAAANDAKEAALLANRVAPDNEGILSAVTAAGGALSAATDIKAQTDQLTFTGGKVNANASVGSGDKQVRLTIKNTQGVAVGDCEVVVTSDDAGEVPEVGPVYTDAFGKTQVLLLSAGTYYRWASKSGETFTNPQAFTVV